MCCLYYLCTCIFKIKHMLGMSDEELPDTMENFKPCKVSTPRCFKPPNHVSNKGIIYIYIYIYIYTHLYMYVYP